MYIYGCMCVGLCECSQMGGQRRDLIFNIFDQYQSIQIFLCLFWHEDHTKTCACVNLQDWKWGGWKEQRTLVSQEWDSCSKRVTHSGSRMQGRQSKMGHQIVKMMTRDESAFLVPVQDFCQVLAKATHTHTQSAKNVTNFTFLCFAVLNPCFVFSSFYPLLVIVNFCSTCEMPTRPDLRGNNGVHTTRQLANKQTN